MDAADALTIYGPLGVFVVLFVVGLVVSKREHDRVIGERDKAWRQRDELIEDVHQRVVPAIERATEAVRARDEADGEVLAALVANREVLTDVRRLLEGQGP